VFYSGQDPLNSLTENIYTMWQLIFTGIFAFLCASSQSNAVERLSHGKALYPHLQILIDPSKTLTLANVMQSPDFVEGRKIVGFKDLAFWVRFELENPNPELQNFIIEDKWILTDLIDIYLIEPNGIVKHRELGHQRPEIEGRGKHRYPYSSLELPPGVSTIYIRYRSDDIIGSRVALWYPEDFEYYKVTTQLVYGLLLGAILVMSLYNFVLFLTLRYVSYLYYAAYAIMFFCFQLCFSGFLSQLTGQYNWWIDQGTAQFASVAMIFIVFFTQTFLHLDQHSLFLHRIGYFLCLLSSVGFVSSMFNFQTSVIFVILGNILVATWLAIAAITTSIKKVPEGYIFLFAWGFFVIGDLCTIAHYTGYAEANIITEWGMIVGSVIEIVLLSFGLANYVNRMKRGMQEAKEALNQELAQNLSKVEALVQEKTRDIKLILQNIQQGIFTVHSERLLIHEEHSAALLPILGTKLVAGQHFSDIFLDKAQLGGDYKSQVISTLTACLNEPSINFEMNSHLLPKEVQFGKQGETARMLELNWEPMVGLDGLVDRILVTLRDVTSDRELQAREAAQSEEIKIISEIFQRNPRLFGSFIKTTERFLMRCRAILQGELQLSPDEGRELYRILHTIKGNARTQRLAQLATAVHNCEDQLKLAIDHPNSNTFDLVNLQSIIQEFEPFSRVFDQHFRTLFDDNRINIHHQTALSLIHSFRSRRFSDNDLAIQEVVKETLHSLKDLTMDLKRDAARIARELGKMEPVLIEDVDGVFMSDEMYEALVNAMGHLLRNSLDHGLESTEDRTLKKKPPFGTLTLKFVGGPNPCLIWSDDGQGLDLERIAVRALENGLVTSIEQIITPEICQKIIFSSGFSTKKTLNEISGRGIGLDAVSASLHEIGAELDLRYVTTNQHARWRNFEIILRLPAHHIFHLDMHPEVRQAS